MSKGQARSRGSIAEDVDLKILPHRRDGPAWRAAHSVERAARLAAAALILSVLVACGLSGPAYRTGQTDAAAVIDLSTRWRFDPHEVTIRVGDTVEWRNRSPWSHSVSADPTLAADPSNVELPAGAAPFASPDIPPGDVFRHTFTTPGRYRYVCVPHEGFDMLGTIIVRAGH